MPLGDIRRIACFGAHADDIEIGCGGTLLRAIESNPRLEVHWVVFSASGSRRREARAGAKTFLAGIAKPQVIIHDFPESYFPQHWGAIKDKFEDLRKKIDPDLVLTHWREDRHQDHRVLSDLAWNTFRDHTILEYEIPKYDGDIGQPNFYVPLDESICQMKVSGILRLFKSQASRHWFTQDTFYSLLRLRGIECGPGSHYAEAFHARKLVMR